MITLGLDFIKGTEYFITYIILPNFKLVIVSDLLPKHLEMSYYFLTCEILIHVAVLSFKMP